MESNSLEIRIPRGQSFISSRRSRLFIRASIGKHFILHSLIACKTFKVKCLVLRFLPTSSLIIAQIVVFLRINIALWMVMLESYFIINMNYYAYWQSHSRMLFVIDLLWMLTIIRIIQFRYGKWFGLCSRNRIIAL